LTDEGAHLLVWPDRPCSASGRAARGGDRCLDRQADWFARPAINLKLALATDGDLVNIKGGLPIMTEGRVIGGIGVGSGTGDQDLEVANAALSRFKGITPS